MSGTKVSGDIIGAKALTFTLDSDGSASAVSNAAISSQTIETLGNPTLWVAIYILATSTPAGNVTVEASLDPTLTVTPWTQVMLEANKVYGVAFTSASVSVAYSAGSDTAILIPLRDPAPFMRVRVGRTSGGTTGAKVTAKFFTRGI